MLLLDKVNTPADVKKLTEEEMNLLAQEIRDKMVETVSETVDIWLLILVLSN